MQEMKKRNSFIMCSKSTCKLSIECYRYRASPDPDQLYNNFSTLCNELDEFRYFIKILEDDNIIELDKLSEGKDNDG